MCARFEAEGAAITRVYHCPYHPLDGIGEYRCDHLWCKPKPGMILEAVSDLALDSARCVILGDKVIDMEAGAAAGIGLRVLIGPHSATPYMGQPIKWSSISAKRLRSSNLASCGTPKRYMIVPS